MLGASADGLVSWRKGAVELEAEPSNSFLAVDSCWRGNWSLAAGFPTRSLPREVEVQFTGFNSPIQGSSWFHPWRTEAEELEQSSHNNATATSSKAPRSSYQLIEILMGFHMLNEATSLPQGPRLISKPFFRPSLPNQ